MPVDTSLLNRKAPWHTLSAEELMARLATSWHGLSQQEDTYRLEHVGVTALPTQAAPSPFRLFFRQFASPLIYILIFAGGMALFLGDYTDAVFIFAVIVFNAILGTVQEFKAEKSAEALQQMLVT